MHLGLKIIYSEYFTLLSNFLKFERDEFVNSNLIPLALDGLVPQEWATKMIARRGTYIDSNSNHEFYTSNEIQKAHCACKEFWKLNGKNFIGILTNEIQSLKVSVLRQRLQRMKKLPVYFDSLLFIDPFHISTANEEFNSLHKQQRQSPEYNINRWASALGDYLVTYFCLESLLEFDFDEPIYILCPDVEMLDKSRISNLTSAINSSHEESFNYLKSELQVSQFNSVKEYIDYINRLSKEDSEHELIKFHTSGIRAKCKASATNEQLQLTYNLLNQHLNPVKKEIFALILINQERFAQINELNAFSASYKSVVGSSTYEWETFMDAIRFKQSQSFINMGVSKEQVVVRTIEKNTIKVFENLTYADLVSFRSDGYMNEIRDLFRTSNISLASARIEDFEMLCNNLEIEFGAALKEASEKIEKDEKQIRKKLKISSGSFIIGTTMGFSTSMLPIFQDYGMASNIISALIGSASLFDIINLHLKNKRTVEGLSFRPTTVFIKEMKKGQE